MRLELCFIIPVRLDDTDLTNQRVLERSVRHQEAVVVAIYDVINIIRRLLCRGNIFRPLRDILHRLLIAMKDPHK